MELCCACGFLLDGKFLENKYGSSNYFLVLTKI
jgi:hypothetical protein